MAEKKFKGVAADFISAMKKQFIGKGADPNEIFVQDLYSYNTNSAIKLSKNPLDVFAKGSMDNRRIVETLLQVYKENIASKKEILEQSRRLFNTDIVQTVIDVMIDDGFNSFTDDTNEFKIEYNLTDEEREILGEAFEQEIQNIFDEVVEKFSLKQRVAELIPEIIRDGEYAWGVLWEDEKGITTIVDELDDINLLPFYEGEKLVFVMNQENYGNKYQETTPYIYKPDNIIFFRLNRPNKKRICMAEFYDEKFRKMFLEKTNIRLPKYTRMCTPLYANALKNLNKLQLMENVSTALDLSTILKPEIVTVTVPQNTTASDATQIMRNYERQLNDFSDLEDADDLDVVSLSTQANRRKVLPQWTDSKGTITTGNLSENPKSAGAWDASSKLRNLIALSIGIPPFYINSTEAPVDKAQIIKLYSRYTRKLTALQKALADGIKDFLLLHCDKKGVRISRENIKITFKAITNGDSLDDTDVMVGAAAGLRDLYKAIEEIVSSENNNYVLDDEQFKKLFDSRMSTYFNTQDLFRIESAKFNTDLQDEEGEEGFESFDSGERDFDEGPDMNVVDIGNEGSEPESESEGGYEEFENTTNVIDIE